jgi:peptidoglycan hydrolase-like protein with peptidoglycan-binding domain
VIDEHCTGWAEVWLLQSLLKCHGINVLIDGIWGQALTEKVKQYQKQNGLDPDGAVGPMSWAKLFER